MKIKNTMKHVNDYKKVIEYAHSFETPAEIRCVIHDLINCQSCRQNKGVSDASLRRSKTLLSDLVIANDFSYFFTFTFDPAKVNSKDHDLSKAKMDNWLSNQRKTNPELKYILVPELHKSGAVHFHLLIDNYTDELIPTHLKTKRGQRIYNIPKWTYGHSTAVPIDNKHILSVYMTKYITKAFIKSKNKKRFWYSQNLHKMQKTHNINIKKHDVIVRYQNHYITIYDNVVK